MRGTLNLETIAFMAQVMQELSERGEDLETVANYFAEVAEAEDDASLRNNTVDNRADDFALWKTGSEQWRDG